MARQVPGLAALNKGGSAAISSVSCVSAGNCTAGGNYADSVDRSQAFVVSETHGTWGKAKEVPGTAALNTGDFGGMGPLSCSSAGNCSAGGGYLAKGKFQVFVVSEKNRIWGTAEKPPGLAKLDKGGDEGISSLSCGSAGNCSAGGHYADSSGAQQAFVISQQNGAWGTAKEIPGTAALNRGGQAEVTSLSCGSAGNCSAGGYYTSSSGLRQAFVAGETNGTWGSAQQIPGVTLAKPGAVTSLSCGSAGNCSAGGYTTNGTANSQAFVVDQANGIWRTAQPVPGLASINAGDAAVGSLSCASPGNCTGGGYYSRAGGQAFVVGETSGPSRPAITAGR